MALLADMPCVQCGKPRWRCWCTQQSSPLEDIRSLVDPQAAIAKQHKDAELNLVWRIVNCEEPFNITPTMPEYAVLRRLADKGNFAQRIVEQLRDFGFAHVSKSSIPETQRVEKFLELVRDEQQKEPEPSLEEALAAAREAFE